MPTVKKIIIFISSSYKISATIYAITFYGYLLIRKH